jgi:tRNA-Thr(GGU) m(6)t(6)A37 methyltransferase TsaA
MEISKREIKDFKDRKFPDKVCFKPIGVIHTSFKTLKGIPVQSIMSAEKGIIEVFKEYQPGLKDLEGFGYIYCLYLFDMVKLPVPLQSKPFLDDAIRGVFAIRSPFRPNPIGLAILKLLKIDGNEIHVANVEMLDKTPILDIKPFIPEIDTRTSDKIGWMKGKIRKKTS